MRDVVGAFAGRVTESIAWIVERGSELRDARRTAEQEFELSEGRRERSGDDALSTVRDFVLETSVLLADSSLS